MKKQRLSKDEWKQQKDAQKQELQNRLGTFLQSALETKDGMADLTAHYRISGLYNYSFYNSILINMQGGTIAQSYNKWKTLERVVNKGEKSRINVFAPMFKKEVNKVTGKEDDVLIGFRLVPVFDVKQTTGKELEYDHNSDEVMDIPYERVAACLSKLADAEVKEEITGEARGYSDGKNLVVSSMSNDTDKTKTLIHEAAHHLIHTGKTKEASISRTAREVEAESVAYLVMSYLGLDYELSKQYVANYQSGIQEARTDLIVRTADKMIKALKSVMSDEEQFLVALS